MRAFFRMFVLLAIVLTLVALPSVVMAAGGQSLSATVATMFGASGSGDLKAKAAASSPASAGWDGATSDATPDSAYSHAASTACVSNRAAS